MNYYNEFDERAAAWLQALIDERHIPNGHIDTRSIRDVTAGDLAGYTQHHFFAGIGGWPLALRLAGWPESRAVWTGSCPCQPFSDAGLGRGVDDPRHLWPVWWPLVRECAPAIVFGEQVASKAALGWLDGVFADLEGAGYACAAADLCAASVGAPHIRQRLFWVADATGFRRERMHERARSDGERSSREEDAGKERRAICEPARNGADGGLGDANGGGSSPGRQAAEANGYGRAALADGGAGGVEHAEGERREQRRPESSGRSAAGGCGNGAGGVADLLGEGLERHAGNGSDGNEPGRLDTLAAGSTAAGGVAGFWDRFDILPFRDGKARRVEPGTFPLAHGVSGRVGLLRGYGNAIVPQAAAEFIQAFVEARGGVA